MNYINLAISVFSLLAAIASAIAAWKSSTSAKAANTLAKEALTKRAQSELFLKALLELARIHRLMTDVLNDDSSDADFIKIFDGKAASELLPLLKELDALSPQFRISIQANTSLTDFMKRLSSGHFSTSPGDLNLLKNMIDQLQNCQRNELSNP